MHLFNQSSGKAITKSDQNPHILVFNELVFWWWETAKDKDNKEIPCTVSHRRKNTKEKDFLKGKEGTGWWDL